MTEEQAKEWVRAKFGVPRETELRRFEELLRNEATSQNLISAATFESLWARHFVDSAQLLDHAPKSGTWLDVGTGAGLPGVIVALLQDRPVVLVEPRRRRVDFLNGVIAELRLGGRVRVEGSKVESIRCGDPVAVISARAVAALPVLFASARHCAGPFTIWLLPKGQSAQSEVEAAQTTWQGTFHVEPSITNPQSGIVIAKGVSPK